MVEGREGSQCKGPEAGLGLKGQRTSKEISKQGLEVKIKAEGSMQLLWGLVFTVRVLIFL